MTEFLHQEDRRRVETVGDAVDEISAELRRRLGMRQWVREHRSPGEVTAFRETLRMHVKALRELREYPGEIPFDDVLYQRREGSE